MSEAEGTLELAAAVELFNAGRWLAAHEVLDELWERTSGPDADFYKGLIQAAVALHHLEEGNAEGAAKLFRGHRRCLGAYLPAHRGIDLAAFLEAMERALRPALGGTAGPLAAEERPRLTPAAERSAGG